MSRRLWLAMGAALLAPALAVGLRLYAGVGPGAGLAEPAWSFALRVLLCATGLVAAVAMVGLRPGPEGEGRARRSSWTTALLGAVMVATATWVLPTAALELRALDEDGARLPTVDLTQGPLPDGAEGLVRVRGYLRDELVLDEYRVAPGEHPDQNHLAPARLVPLLDTLDDEVHARGRVVVARISAKHGTGEGELRTLTGVLVPLPSEILGALFDRAPSQTLDASATPELRGVMLDTLRAPTKESAGVKVALGAGAALLALALLLAAAPVRNKS